LFVGFFVAPRRSAATCNAHQCNAEIISRTTCNAATCDARRTTRRQGSAVWAVEGGC
jgi:hypothetical protein